MKVSSTPDSDTSAESGSVSALVVQPEARALARQPDAPELSSASSEQLQEIPARDENDERRRIHVPVERALKLVVDGEELVTLMTLGASPEWLVIGYLRNQRLIESVTQLQSVAVEWGSGTAVVRTRTSMANSPLTKGQQPGRTGCGLGTGFGDLLDAGVGVALGGEGRISRTSLLSILETMRQHDAIHRAAGSVHSCALFHGTTLWVAVEDVSRHNGLDTITGWMALHGVDGADKILFTTGRLTGEMVMKAAHNGIAILVSRNGVTSMGYDVAVRLGMTLFGREANRRYVCYAGFERFDASL